MKSRRGISSVVGTVFAIIALSTTVGYITYSMTVLDQYNASVIARNQQASDVEKEKFQVSSVTYVNSKLNITVTNTGSLPVNFTKIWITDKSVTPNSVKNYVPKICAPSPNTQPPCLVATANTLKNLGQDAPASLNLNTIHAYHVKLVTSRGNTNEFDVNSASTAPLNIQLLANPSTIASGLNTTLVMVVTNNQTGTLTQITPNTLSNSDPTACSLRSLVPSSYNILPPGSTAIFKWDVNATGVGKTCTFNATLNNGYIIPATNHIQSVLTKVNVSPTMQNTKPLNIQMYALPSTVPAGFKMQLIMVVINNQSATLQNITPNTPSNSNPADCTLSSVSPASYDALSPGSIAIFKWDVTTIVNAVGGDTCTFTLTTPLQGGHSQTVSATTTITTVSLSATGFAKNAGTLTIDYTSWQWSQGNGWTASWIMAHNVNTGFWMKLTNNDPTRTFYLGNKTSVIFTRGTAAPTTSYLVSSVTPSPLSVSAYTCTGYPKDDYCTSIIPGGTIDIFIGASSVSTTNLQGLPNQGGPTTAFLLIFGKFDTSRAGNGPLYAQDLPYIAIYLT